jgi:ligand-binding sensor protein
LSLKLADLVPQKWLQTTQDIFADLLGFMLVVTDMEGEPLTDPSNPCGLFTEIGEANTHHSSWSDVIAILDLTPKFTVMHLGLLCTRSLIVVGTEIKGAVIAGCVAPDEWPPLPEEMQTMAVRLGASAEVFPRYAREV